MKNLHATVVMLHDYDKFDMIYIWLGCCNQFLDKTKLFDLLEIIIYKLTGFD